MNIYKRTQNYILEDLARIDDTCIGSVLRLPNEITLLRDNSLSPELKERLGLVMSANPVKPQPKGATPNRHKQSLSDTYNEVKRSLDALPDNANIEENK
ncbi:hypothetical protein [Capybara microvirus Cap1_SP_82]|nr:hypothetical protein [Capybara microvirus Cap1_SP_82]